MAPVCSELGLVNAFIGTGGYGYGVGSLSPAAQLPFGALRLGPDTASSAADAGWRHASGYNWADSFVRAFSHTRLVGAGVVDLGNVGVMPLLLGPEPEAGWRLADFGFAEASEPGAVDHTPLAWWSLYDRASEAASPGRYSVDLLGPNATAEMLAASTYAGIHRYTFHGATAHAGEVAEPALAVDVCHASGYALPDLAHGDGTCLNASFALSLDGQTFDSQVHFQGRLSGNVVTAFVHGALPAPLPAPSPART
jgi:putative alpha-1,2-mannosidase